MLNLQLNDHAVSLSETKWSAYEASRRSVPLLLGDHHDLLVTSHVRMGWNESTIFWKILIENRAAAAPLQRPQAKSSSSAATAAASSSASSSESSSRQLAVEKEEEGKGTGRMIDNGVENDEDDVYMIPIRLSAVALAREVRR